MNTTYFNKIIFGCLFFFIGFNNLIKANTYFFLSEKDKESNFRIIEETWEEGLCCTINKGSNCGDNIEEEENISHSRSTRIYCNPGPFIASICGIQKKQVQERDVTVTSVINGQRCRARVYISGSKNGIVIYFNFSNSCLANNTKTTLSVTITALIKNVGRISTTKNYEVCPIGRGFSTDIDQDLRVDLNSASTVTDLNLKVTPNPFSNNFNVQFDLNEPADVNINLYNTLGQLKAVLTADKYTEGFHSIDYKNSDLPKGYYLIRYQDGTGFTKIHKVLKL